ncbi:TonB-dependent receptor [uncultured Caulobacter sp.]|uniref:TonB-dependent receptor n=1 Tax=uncultured Caulobacter sp. TaxID=158749 RepID=UPI0026107630|nr:TonB-dependent receptor [uncultured Caulobacter sp.]
MRFSTGASVFALALAVGAGQGWSARAQEAASTVEAVTVTGRVRSLEQFTPTSSRLGLSSRETPATLDVVTAETITTRGYATVEQAANSLPGVTSGGSPGDPASFSMRGFTGDQITVLHNGLYLGPSNMTNRPQNTFNLQSVEILKGPSSVLYGQGAIGGAVNVTNKAPSFGAPHYELQAGFGSFGSTSFGFGAGGGLSENVGVRFDISRTASDGFVDDSASNALNATLSVLWRVRDDLDIQASIDYGEDEPTNYYGTPLVPASFAKDPIKNLLTASNGYVVDEAMRFKNYNVADSKIYDHQIWPQVLVRWRPAEGITVQNLAYYFTAKRRWINAETYVFNTTTSRIDRDRFFVFHEQELYGDQGSIAIERPLFGLSNKFLVGFDYSHLDFKRSRGFPDGDSVDPYNPSPGRFGAIVPRLSPTSWDDVAVFFEDALNVTQKLKLVVGGRYEVLDLDRKNYGPTGAFQPATSFSRKYKPSTWRAGLVYNLNEYVTPYVSYTTGKDPVNTNIFIVNAGENFSLSSSRQAEAGVKASLPGNRASITAAIFDIKRRNVLTQVAIDTVSNVGAQTSKGFELSGDVQLTRQWSVNANLAYTKARYEDFVDPNYGVDASGRAPPNVPDWIANVWTSVTDVGGLPLELGGGLRYVGAREGNTAGTLKLDKYALVDLYATYAITPKASVTGRINNAFDKAYVGWADIFYPSEVMLGKPRSYEVSLNVKF